MLRPQAIVSLYAAALSLLIFCGAAQAAAQSITALPLQAEGDNRWRLPAGEYQGSFSIDQPMHILCEAGAVLQGEGQGNGLLISAPDVTVEGCTLLDWGRDMTAMNAAIFIQPKARGAVIKNNRMQGPGFGIWSGGISIPALTAARMPKLMPMTEARIWHTSASANVRGKRSPTTSDTGLL